jgi:hypothetical protein
MRNKIFYKTRQSFRVVGVLSLFIIGLLWLAISNHNHEQFTVTSKIITGIFCFLAFCSLMLVIIGGHDYLEINEDAILWRLALWNFVIQEKLIRHNEVDYFESTVPTGMEGAETRVFLKTGESVRIPIIGNQLEIYTTLLGIWPYRETNQNRW